MSSVKWKKISFSLHIMITLYNTLLECSNLIFYLKLPHIPHKTHEMALIPKVHYYNEKSSKESKGFEN